MARISATVLLLWMLGACWRIGEPVESTALVTWAAYPDTVLAGQVFPFEVAGPVSPDACGRLDTVTVELRDGELLLGARRSVYDTMCADSPVAFYEARALTLAAAGTWRVRTREGRDLGTIVAVDSGAFSPMRTVGEGTLRAAGGCLLFGPGWVGNQRPFALRGAGPDIEALAGTDRRAWIAGELAGFTTCGAFGSRPVIRVEEARPFEATAADYYGTGFYETESGE
ncbi:MAG: hypothetical protein RRA92_01645 [Gemmatimonadota bacterium]|nr:hypothetical protein [Gemmatimonadota bacterium]